MTTYGVIYERAEDGSWSARAADLPVFVVGRTRDEAEREIRAAISTYLDELRRDGKAEPRAASIVGEVSI